MRWIGNSWSVPLIARVGWGIGVNAYVIGTGPPCCTRPVLAETPPTGGGEGRLNGLAGSLQWSAALGQAAGQRVVSQFELLPRVESGLQMMPCFLRSACSSPDTQPKTFGSPSSFWTK